MPVSREKVAAALKYLQENADVKARLQRSISLNPQPQDAVDLAIETGAGFTPLQYAQAFRDFERARRENDSVGMGLSTLAAVPFVGGVAKAANVGRKTKSAEKLMSRAVEAGKMSPSTAAEISEAERLADQQAIATQVGLNSRKAEGAKNLLLKSIESDNPDFRHDDARAAIERMQGLLQSRTQQNNPMRSRLNAAYQYSNSIGGMTKPDAQMSATQRKVLAGILRGEIAYNEAGELQRIK